MSINGDNVPSDTERGPSDGPRLPMPRIMSPNEHVSLDLRRTEARPLTRSFPNVGPTPCLGKSASPQHETQYDSGQNELSAIQILELRMAGRIAGVQEAQLSAQSMIQSQIEKHGTELRGLQECVGTAVETQRSMQRVLAQYESCLGGASAQKRDHAADISPPKQLGTHLEEDQFQSPLHLDGLGKDLNVYQSNLQASVSRFEDCIVSLETRVHESLSPQHGKPKEEKFREHWHHPASPLAGSKATNPSLSVEMENVGGSLFLEVKKAHDPSVDDSRVSELQQRKENVKACDLLRNELQEVERKLSTDNQNLHALLSRGLEDTEQKRSKDACSTQDFLRNELRDIETRLREEDRVLNESIRNRVQVVEHSLREADVNTREVLRSEFSSFERRLHEDKKSRELMNDSLGDVEKKFQDADKYSRQIFRRDLDDIEQRMKRMQEDSAKAQSKLGGELDIDRRLRDDKSSRDVFSEGLTDMQRKLQDDNNTHEQVKSRLFELERKLQEKDETRSELLQLKNMLLAVERKLQADDGNKARVAQSEIGVIEGRFLNECRSIQESLRGELRMVEQSLRKEDQLAREIFSNGFEELKQSWRIEQARLCDSFSSELQESKRLFGGNSGAQPVSTNMSVELGHMERSLHEKLSQQISNATANLQCNSSEHSADLHSKVEIIAARLNEFEQVLAAQRAEFESAGDLSARGSKGRTSFTSLEALALDRPPPEVFRLGLPSDSIGERSSLDVGVSPKVLQLIEAEREARTELARTVASERSARVQAEEQMKVDRWQAEDRMRSKLAKELQTDLAHAVEEVEEVFLAKLAKAMDHVAELTHAAEKAAREASDRSAFMGHRDSSDDSRALDSKQKLHLRETAELRKDIKLLSEKVIRMEDGQTQSSYASNSTPVARTPSGAAILAMRDEIRKELQDEIDDMRVDIKGDFETFRRKSVDMAATRIDPNLLQGLDLTMRENATPRSSFSETPRSNVGEDSQLDPIQLARPFKPPPLSAFSEISS